MHARRGVGRESCAVVVNRVVRATFHLMENRGTRGTVFERAPAMKLETRVAHRVLLTVKLICRVVARSSSRYRLTGFTRAGTRWWVATVEKNQGRPLPAESSGQSHGMTLISPAARVAALRWRVCGAMTSVVESMPATATTLRSPPRASPLGRSHAGVIERNGTGLATRRGGP